jgi:hypothetical protein
MLGFEPVEEPGHVLDATFVLVFGEFVACGNEPSCGGRVLPDPFREEADLDGLTVLGRDAEDDTVAVA